MRIPSDIHIIRNAGIALVAYLAIVAWVVISLIQEHGVFTYGLDDAYIHLEIAKNWATSGIPGVNAGEFALGSSSPIYTGILVVSYWLTGPDVFDWVPLFLNLIAGCGLLTWLTSRLLNSPLEGRWIPLFVLLLLPLAAIPSLTLFGMEHLLHVWLFVMFLDLMAKVISDPATLRDHSLRIAVLAILLGGIRFEGLVACGLILGFAWLQNRSWRYILIGILACIPVAMIVLINWKHTGYLLPNSVYMKLNPPRGTLAALSGIKRTISILGTSIKLSPIILPGLITCTLLFLLRLKKNPDWPRNQGQVYLFLWVAVCLVHALGGTYVILRYEAYLLAGLLIGLMLYGKPILEALPIPTGSWLTRWSGGIMAVLISGLLWQHYLYLCVYEPSKGVRLASSNIYSQQYQMMEFVESYYPGETIAINDLGLMSFGTSARVIDLEGLGTNQVADLNRSGNYSWKSLLQILDQEGVRIAILYEDWYTDIQFSHPGRVATWTADNGYILGDETVSFFAWDPDLAGQLQRDLQAFEANLPNGVQVHYDALP